MDRFSVFLERYAYARVLLALLALAYCLLVRQDEPSPRHIISTMQVLGFGVGGIFLSRLSNRRAEKSQLRLFSLVLLLIADVYVQSAYHLAFPKGSDYRTPAIILAYSRIDYFSIWYLWRFLENFPATNIPFLLQKARLFLERVALLSASAFVLLWVPLWVYWALWGLSDEMIAIAELRAHAWLFLLPQASLAVVFLAIRYRYSSKPEQRRVRLFSTGLAFGILSATILDAAYRVSSTTRELFDSGPDTVRVIGNIFILTIPLITGYAVVAQKVLDVKLIARSAVQHLLARYSATALGLLPFVFLVIFLFHNRDLTLVQLFSGKQAPVLFGASALGMAFLRYREPILDAIDRRFFRDQYNSRLVLTQLAEQVRGTRNLTELSNMVGKGVDLALHLDRVALLTQDPALGRFVDPLEQLRPLDPASRLATLVQSNREPLEVDFDSPSSPLHGLAEPEKHWLVDGQVELLAPAFALDGAMIGMLVLGGKKSDMPYLREDRDLLRSVCSAAGLVIELLFLKEKTPLPKTKAIPPSPSGRFPALPAIDPEQGAVECLACSKIYPAGDTVCPNCKLELDPTLVPYVLRNQYRFESRLGTGGMAVVYRATDLRLGRTVAIKTLPRVSPDAAMRLHREARTAATVTHSGLAGIYGIETWDGVPMLVLEFLPGGTLADQLMRDEPLDTLLAIDMGQAVALALQKIHSAGILHRDIKPSNIGYTEDGHAKLLDFGVARIHHDLRQEAETDGDEDDPAASHSRVLNTASWVIGRTATGQLVGTLSYLSPEAVRGQRPDPSFDLWALSVVLWESLTGENLFIGRNYRFILDDIMAVKVRDIRQHLPDCPEPVAEFFAKELSADRSDRAQSGFELHERLGRLRERLLS